MRRIRRVMLASDFSRTSRLAFDKAVEMAKVNRAKLIVLHVLGPAVPLTAGEFVSPQIWDQLERSMRHGVGKKVNALAARAGAAGVRASGLLLEGNAAEQIVRAAKSKRADLLVLGTHGRTGVAKFLLGSVAARVIATAPCPVLTIRSR